MSKIFEPEFINKKNNTQDADDQQEDYSEQVILVVKEKGALSEVQGF